MAAMLGAATVSCQKDDTIQYDNPTMGNIVDGTFTSDQGNIFNVVEQNCLGRLDTMKRAFVVCDVLKKTAGGADNEYDVRINQIANVLVKNAVPAEEADEETMVEDPVHIEYIWISGGYINMFVMFPIRTEGSGSHMINLVYEGEISETPAKDGVGSYRFTLRHNSFGDKIDHESSYQYVLSGGYVSFPMSTFISEDKANIRIDWLWHKSAGAGLSSETEYKTLTGTFTQDGYQHAPTALASRSVTSVR